MKKSSPRVKKMKEVKCTVWFPNAEWALKWLKNLHKDHKDMPIEITYKLPTKG